MTTPWHYEQALALTPEFAAAHCNLGVALKEQGELAAAVARFERALLVKPDYAEAHSNVATVLTELGQLAEADCCCKRSISTTISPRQSAPMRTKGVTPAAVFPLSAGLTNALALGLGAGDLRRGPRASH